ncbi:MAG: hypothetical protein H6R22_1183, partial [Chromatiaceae bacterium]|nr:hypothetical protein [Chromatiaceae bacterium]
FRMEMRTLLAAQRWRRWGEARPPGAGWGYGRWVAQIERYWQEPGFRLERVFPWVTESERLLRADDSLGLERLNLSVNWAHLDRMSEGHWFDFEAVVLYVLRWDLIARWTGQDKDAALGTLRRPGGGRAWTPRRCPCRHRSGGRCRAARESLRK